MYNAHVVTHFNALAGSMCRIAGRGRSLRPYHVALWGAVRALRLLAREG